MSHLLSLTMGSLADWCLVTGRPNVFLIRMWSQCRHYTLIRQSSPGSHGLCVVRRGDGRGPGQVPLPHSPLSLTWPGGRGRGVFVPPVAWAGVGLVALQHVLGIGGRGGEVLQRFGD